jgi:ribose transport system substrate-binding protein
MLGYACSFGTLVTTSSKVSHMRRSILSLAVALSATLALASCAMPADDPNFVEGESVVGEELESDTVALDENLLENAVLAPTSIGVEAPLTAPPAAGSLIVSLSDGTEFDALLNESMAEAAELVGWEFQEVTGAETADSVPAAFAEALTLKPAGIRISGAHVNALQTQLAEAEAAGVAVICTGCSGEPEGALKDTSIDGDAQNILWGQILASYVAANQGPEEVAGVEVFALPATALATFNLEFSNTLASLCRECSVIEAFIDEADLSSVPDLVAETMSTSLGRWALLDSGNVSEGVAEALESALVFEPVVLLGRGASARDIAVLQEIADSGAVPPTSDTADGSPEQALALQAWIGLPVPVMGWRVIDQFARVLGGDAPADGLLPSQLLTSTNVADAALDESGNYIGVSNYKELFAQLWGVS